VAEPQLTPLRVTSEQQDDRKEASAAGAFDHKQNNDANIHDKDSYARTVRDVAEPQLKPLRVTSEQQDDRKVASAAGAFDHEQNNDENIDPVPFEKMDYFQKLIAQVSKCMLCFRTCQLLQSNFVVCYSRFKLVVKTNISSKKR
jgi:hypothetical protein